MRFALVWISATITTVTAIIAAEHAHSNADRRSASFNFICAEQGEKHPGGEKLHPQKQTLRMLLPKGRENTSTWSSRSGFSRLNKNAFQGQVSTEGAETWRASPAASERQWQLQRNTPHQSSRAERDGLRVQHDRMQLTYDSPSVKRMNFPKDSLRNVDADRVLYRPKIKGFDTIDAPYSLEKPASLSGRQRSPGERLDYSSTRMQPKHPAVYPPQRLPEEPHTLGEVDLEDMYGPGSLQNQKRNAYPNGIEVLVSGSEAFSSQGHYPRGSEDTSRQKPAVIRTNYTAQSDALTRPRATPETHSLLTRRSEKRSHPQQQQREARPQSRDMLNIVQGGKHSVINQRQPTEEGRLPPLRPFNPSSEESNRNYGSSASGTSSKKQSLLGGRQKVATAKDSLFGKTDILMKRRKERRSYRKGDTVNAMDIDVAASSRAGSALLHRKNDEKLQHDIHANALSTEEYLVDTAEELPRMSKSVLDLGVDDLQMLADILYDLKAAHYAERLEEGSKRREAQEGMFFSRLNRSQERQKLLRRENELKDEKKLKSLEESLRFTKPLSAYHDLFLGGGTHKGERNSGTGIRSHKDSDYKKRIRMADETGHERGGTTVWRSPKKKGNWREKRQKQMIALDLIEREDQAEEGSGRTSRPRRRSARGAEEQENGEGTYSGAEGENLNRRAGSMFLARKSVPTSRDRRDDPPSVVGNEDLRGPSQAKEKREAGWAHTEDEGRGNIVDNQGEIGDTTSPGRNAEFSDQQEASAAQIKWAGKNAHAGPPGVATTGLHKTDTLQRDTIEEEQHENIAEKGQDGGTELDTFDLLSTGGTNTATGLLPDKAFSSADAEADMVDKKSGEILSAVIDDDGAEKVLAEKIYEDSLHQGGSEHTDAASEGLQSIITAPFPGQHVVPEKGTEKVHQGEITHVQADLNGVQEHDSPHLLPSHSTSQRLGQPPVDEQYTREQEDEMEKVEDTDFLTKNRAPIFDVSNPSKEFSPSNLSSADASETLVKPQLTVDMQDKERATSGGSPEEDEGVEGSGEDGGESEGESVEGEPENEVFSSTLTLADDVPVTAEEYAFSEESGPEPFTLEALLTNIATSRAGQPPLRQPRGGSSHMLEKDSPILETAPNITEGDTSSEGRLSERKFRKEATRLIDTYASRGNAGLSAEVTKNPGRPTTFKRGFEHTVDAPSSSSTEALPLSPSRLARFRARHFRSDATEKPESVGKQAERVFDRGAQNRHVDQAYLSLPTGREDIYFSPYRRLQFTSKKKSVLDRNTSARLEFVDNDHGSQFVNWRSIDGERMIEKLWVSSMEEADRHQRKQVRREIESAFANEFDAVRTKKQLLQALGVSGPDEGENEQQLAQRYYSAMQEVLHGSEEEVLTGQAFGRYIPSINQSFITDIRNRIIYGPWSVNWNRAITSRTQRVSVGSRRGAVSVGSSASSYVTTVNVNWGRVAVTFAARPNDQAVKVGVLKGRYGVDIARSNRLRTSAVETVMRYVESATVVDQINRTYGQRIRVRRFSFNYTRDFTLPAFDSPGRTPGLRQELGVNWGTVGISVGTDVPDSEYAVSVGLRGYQFSVLRDFFQRLIQAQGNWGRGWQFELAAKIEDPISPLVFYQFGFGRLGRLYSTAGAGVGGDNTPMALFQIQGDRSSVAVKAMEQAGVRVFNIGFTVGRFTYSWDSVVNYDQIALPLSHISPILKALLHVTP